MSELPYYILLSQPSSSLVHPAIQYHFADDPPISLLPSSPGETVLVLDYDPSSSNPPAAQSLSTNTAVTSVKVTDAPGAAVAKEGEPKRNDKMFIIETIAETRATEDAEGTTNPYTILAQFRQRNAVLRSAMDFPPIQAEPTHPDS
ncbi:hypothetical protein BD410DRAFT_781205 [Rickenella mellea]|uniref:Uncharacterized protein n=1 Tax=Rickenella mellea TaxID=50990 RepID=A0A4Y7QN50_9AGAM|nr:hypothetical protein BD410DRAFT_781205 [Rickenella mellea]